MFPRDSWPERSTNTRKTSRRHFVIMPTEQTQCRPNAVTHPLSLSPSLSLSLYLSLPRKEKPRVTRVNIRHGSESLRVATRGVYPAAWANKTVFKSLTISKGGGVKLSNTRAPAPETPCKLSGDRNRAAFRLLPRCLPAAGARFSRATAPNTGFEERLRPSGTFNSPE